METESNDGTVTYELTKIGERVVSQYEGMLFNAHLINYEVVPAIRQGDQLFELERWKETILGDKLVVQCYCSSWPLEFNTIRFIRARGKVLVENVSTFSQDEDGAPIKLGAHPYYLVMTRKK